MKLGDIVEALRTGKRKAKLRALVKLRAMGAASDAARSLVLMLLHEGADEQIRATAADTICEIADPNDKEAVQELRKACGDSHPLVQGAAAVGLYYLSEQETAISLIQLMTQSGDTETRKLGEHFSTLVEMTSESCVQPDECHSQEFASEFDYVPETGAWRTNLSFVGGDNIDVNVQTKSAEIGPSESQGRALDRVKEMPRDLFELMLAAYKQREIEFLGESENDDDDDDTFVTGIFIPPLRNANQSYFFLLVDSVIDLEHGTACLFRDDTFAICHGDVIFDNYDWDDVDVLDQLIAS